MKVESFVNRAYTEGNMSKHLEDAVHRTKQPEFFQPGRGHQDVRHWSLLVRAGRSMHRIIVAVRRLAFLYGLNLALSLHSLVDHPDFLSLVLTIFPIIRLKLELEWLSFS